MALSNPRFELYILSSLSGKRTLYWEPQFENSFFSELSVRWWQKILRDMFRWVVLLKILLLAEPDRTMIPSFDLWVLMVVPSSLFPSSIHFSSLRLFGSRDLFMTSLTPPDLTLRSHWEKQSFPGSSADRVHLQCGRTRLKRPSSSSSSSSSSNAGDLGLIPRLGRSPGEGNGLPLQYSGLENSIDCIVHGVAESDMTEWFSLGRNRNEMTDLIWL